MGDNEKIQEIYNFLLGKGLHEGKGVNDILKKHGELIKCNSENIKVNATAISKQSSLYYKVAGFSAGIGAIFGFVAKYFIG